MKNLKKITILLVSFLLLTMSCKDNTFEDLEPFIGKKCLEKTYETYEKGQFISRKISEYDDFDRLSKQTIISSNSTSITLYEYDKNNNLIRLTDEKGQILNTYQYDSNNKLIKEGNENNTAFVIYYTYHSNSNLQKKSTLLAGLPYSISEFDEKGNLLRRYNAVIEGGDILSSTPLKIVEETESVYKYNAKNYMLSNYVTKNKTFFSSHEYEYNADGRIVKCTIKDLTGTIVDNYTYQVDNKNRVISKKTNNFSEIKYEYNEDDSISKIISFVNNQLHATTINEYNSSKRLIRTFELNPMGNIGYKNERTYYSNNNLKTSQIYYSKKGTVNELYKLNDSEFSPCGNIIKNINLSNDGSEERRVIATYLYR